MLKKEVDGRKDRRSDCEKGTEKQTQCLDDVCDTEAAEREDEDDEWKEYDSKQANDTLYRTRDKRIKIEYQSR